MGGDIISLFWAMIETGVAVIAVCLPVLYHAVRHVSVKATYQSIVSTFKRTSFTRLDSSTRNECRLDELEQRPKTARDCEAAIIQDDG